MKKPLSPETPQFRTALIRKLRNLIPDYKPEFLNTEKGICFVIMDFDGNICSNPITIYRNKGDALQTTSLIRAFKRGNFRGLSNFSAMMQEYCVGLGYCGSDTHVTDLIPKEEIVSADQFICLLLQAEGLEPYEFKMRHNKTYQALSKIFIQHMGSSKIEAARLSFS